MGQDKEIQPSNFNIWIIGNSVLMDGVVNCLKDRKVKTFLRFEEIKNDFDECVQNKKPRLIIFELDMPGSYTLLDVLRDQPGTQLLGIDRNCSQIIQLNSLQRQTRSMADLYQFVMEITANGE